MISVKNLTKKFKTPLDEDKKGRFLKNLFNREYTYVEAVKDISFEIETGELVGFLGPNGAGKTTTMKMLSGVLYPTSGSLEVLGYTPFEKDHDYLRKIAFVMGQRSSMMWELPPIDTFKLNQTIYDVSDTQFKKTLNKLVDILDAGEFITRPVKTLSLGQRMKCELIAALIHTPKVLFLDEPTIGLDVIAQKTMRDFIQNYQKEFESTILLTSHYMEDVRKLAKRIIVIDKGKIMYDGALSKMVEKYAKYKYVEVTLENTYSKSELLKVGKLHTFEFPKAVFRTTRKDLPDTVHNVTQKLQFSDINIEEEKVEDIVRMMFEGK